MRSVNLVDTFNLPKLNNEVKGQEALNKWQKEASERAPAPKWKKEIEKEIKTSWTEIPNKILDNPLLSCQEKMVLVILYRYACSKNYCYPPIEKIARSANIRRQNLFKILKSLENQCFIKKHSRFGHSTIYELVNLDKMKIDVLLKNIAV